MSSLFADTHNVVAILEKSDAAEGFEQIIDFLSGSYIHYALIVNPHIYISCIKQSWNTAFVKRSGNVTRLQALVDKKKIVISEEVVEVVTTAKLITEVVTAAASQVSAASTTIPAASVAIPAAKPSIPAAAPTVVVAYTRRRKGVIIRDPKEEFSSRTPAKTLKMKDKGKGIMVETPKPMKKKDQIELDAEYARKFDENMRFLFKSSEEIEEEDQEIIKSINETPAQKAAKRRKLSEEAQEAKDLRKRLEVVEDEDDDVFVEATSLASKVPIVDYHIVLVDNKPRFKIIRADETHQFYISFTTLLKNFDREDLENL
nr:hypothetical protein [Tanacetum cinerariifolium]